MRGEGGLPVRVFERQAVNQADRIIVDSEFTRQRIMYHYDISQEKVDVVELGVDPIPPIQEEQLRATREAMHLGNVPFILFIGRLDEPRKGVIFLLKAFQKVAETQEVNLVLVGRGDQNEVRTMARVLGIDEKVRMPGFIENGTLNDLFTLCSVYASPSSVEGFGLSIGTALSAGKPVVAVRTGIVPGLSSIASNLRIVSPGDLSGFSAALRFFLNHGDDPTGRAISPNAILEKFNWRKTAELTEKSYRRVVADGQ
jgi:glycosyltransferase involved in cell wall biosynthesis